MSTVNKEYSEVKRMANMGIEIETKQLGTLTVRELALESIINLGGDLVQLMQSLYVDKEIEEGVDLNPEEGLGFIQSLLKNPLFLKVTQKAAAVSCDRKPEEFEGLGLSDWLKWVKAFKTVTDWTEIKDLFFEIVPAEKLKESLKGLSNLMKSGTP